MHVWRVADGLGIARSANRVAIIDPRFPGRPPVILENSAALIWGLVESGESDAEKALSEVGIDSAALPEFLQALSDLDLIEKQQPNQKP